MKILARKFFQFKIFQLLTFVNKSLTPSMNFDPKESKRFYETNSDFGVGRRPLNSYNVLSHRIFNIFFIFSFIQLFAEYFTKIMIIIYFNDPHIVSNFVSNIAEKKHCSLKRFILYTPPWSWYSFFPALSQLFPHLIKRKAHAIFLHKFMLNSLLCANDEDDFYFAWVLID